MYRVATLVAEQVVRNRRWGVRKQAGVLRDDVDALLSSASTQGIKELFFHVGTGGSGRAADKIAGRLTRLSAPR